MKTRKRIYTSLLALFLLYSGGQLNAQLCAAGFNYTVGLNNTLTFVSTCTPALASTSYTWSFGAGYLFPFSGVGPAGTQTSATYTTTGTFIVSITMSNTAPACMQTFTAAVNISNCSINFTNTPASTTLCTGASTAAAQGFCGPVTYSWSGAGIGNIKNNLCPGAYTVIAAGNNPSCCPQAAGVVVINTVNPCVLNSSFQRTLQPNGLVNFVSTSTGTNAGSQYVWTFGDGTSGLGSSTTHTYSGPGAYPAFLTVINNSITCLDTSVIQIITPLFCNLSLSATANYSSPSALQFNGSASGTFSTTTYSWRFGDGTSANGLSPTHTYSVPGTYTVTFLVNNNTTPACRDSMQLIVNSHCNLLPNFTHTVLANGLVSFNAGPSGTLAGSSFLWDFGDGYGDITANPTHQYTNGGTHYVKLKIVRGAYPACKDSSTQAINITGLTCAANANFLLSPSGMPQVWWATPVYPYNVSTAVWSWGDGTSSAGMYPSHTYSAAGNYSICLSVTLSCNATASYCTYQYLSKSGPSSIIQINIMRPALKLGVDEITKSLDFVFYPNPNNGKFNLRIPEKMSGAEVSILDLNGRMVTAPIRMNETSQEVDLMLPVGFYIIQLKNSGGLSIQKKMIVD